MENCNLKLRAHQIKVSPYSIQENIEQILFLFSQSTADLSIFPEAASTGFPYRKLREISSANANFLKEIQSEAKKNSRGILLPLLIEENGHYWNRQHLIGPSGELLSIYDKIHLIGALNEDRFLKPGSRIVSSMYPLPDNSGNIVIGMATCYDLRFPELFRKLTLEHGVDLILVPAMWPEERRTHLEILAPARAIENQTPVIVCNGVGPCGRINLCGRSSVHDARGNCLHISPSDTTDSIDFCLDLKATAEWRETFPALKDARLIENHGL